MTAGQGPLDGPGPRLVPSRQDTPSRPDTPSRLKKRKDFLAAAKGRRAHTERMSIQALARSVDPDAGLRIGFTVTKREGNAVQRNRVRRRLRAAVVAASGGFLHHPADVVLIGRRAALGAPFPRLVDDVASALGRLVASPKPGGRPSSRSSHA